MHVSPMLIRALMLFMPLILTVDVWLWRRPQKREALAALLAFLWNLPVLLALHLAAQHLHWWTFHADGGTLYGLPVDLYIGWALLWGPLPALACRRIPLPVVAGFLLAVDVFTMPLAEPLLVLAPSWWIGEGCGLLAG
ncbi:MAG: isoprenylcysteine carboxylmethyltransferase family protein, partial [Candidatus Tectomicrobia bacterium]